MSAILDEVGVRDVVALVDAMPGERRAAVSPERLKQWLLRAGMRSSAPQPGPLPPVFERYTTEAQRAVRAASETAALLEHHYVDPLHLLLGCLHVRESLAWRVLDAELAVSDMGMLGEAMERARMYGPSPSHQATGIFARRHDTSWPKEHSATPTGTVTRGSVPATCCWRRWTHGTERSTASWAAA